MFIFTRDTYQMYTRKRVCF